MPFDQRHAAAKSSQPGESRARAAKIVYYYPVHADVLLRQKRLALDRRIGIYGYECLAFDVV